jgi:histidine ammonia-lyase
VTVVLTGSDLTIDEVVRVARRGEPVELAAEARDRMRAARAVAAEVLARGEQVYGSNTGVGMRKRFVVKEETSSFNRGLVAGHLIGQGPPARDEAVRATMLRLANGLAQGAPGVRVELAELVVAALNDGLTPRVRLLGSVGQSDLSANADLAHGLLVDFALADGEALALLNNNAFSTAIAALAVSDFAGLLDALDVTAALDLEAFAANLSPLDPAVGEARPYPGLRTTLARLRELIAGSSLWNEPPRNLQDPLSFRSAPQVHGAARDALAYVHRVLSVELNSHQGNPLVVADGGRVVSVGNFDVVPLAAALDFLRIALAPVLTSAAERALKLLQAPLTGLPEGLGAERGLAEPALSELGAAVQAFVAEARLLAQPVSFELASTSQHEGIEDRTTMAPLAARRLEEMVGLGARVAAVELTIAAQAIDLRRPAALGAGTRRAYDLVRERVPFTATGEALPPDLEPVVELVRSRELLPRES